MIKVDYITKSFGLLKALDGISFEAKKGEVLGLLGPNGAGKTTTLKILSGYWQPDTGKVQIAGFDILKKPEVAKRKIGYLPESLPLYEDMRVFEYLKFVAEIRDIVPEQLLIRIKEVAEMTGLTTVMGKTIAQLSKGYRQRIGLAQAIMHDPEVLILDEPTTGLDPNQIVEIRELIKKISLEKTILFSTHILSEAAAVCNRVVIINHGGIVAEDTPSNLVNLVDKKCQPTVTLDFKAPFADFQKLFGDSTAVKNITLLKETPTNTLVRLTVNDLEAAREQLAVGLAQAAWPVYELSYQQVSLEDVFKELTKD